jgi:hypothetical protein
MEEKVNCEELNNKRFYFFAVQCALGLKFQILGIFYNSFIRFDISVNNSFVIFAFAFFLTLKPNAR